MGGSFRTRAKFSEKAMEEVKKHMPTAPRPGRRFILRSALPDGSIREVEVDSAMPPEEGDVVLGQAVGEDKQVFDFKAYRSGRNRVDVFSAFTAHLGTVTVHSRPDVDGAVLYVAVGSLPDRARVGPLFREWDLAIFHLAMRQRILPFPLVGEPNSG